jgi:hypothetical protein
MWHPTERTRKQVNNTLIPAKYQKDCFSKLNRLKPLSSSRMVFAVLAGETTFHKPFAWPLFVALIAVSLQYHLLHFHAPIR